MLVILLDSFGLRGLNGVFSMTFAIGIYNYAIDDRTPEGNFTVSVLSICFDAREDITEDGIEGTPGPAETKAWFAHKQRIQGESLSLIYFLTNLSLLLFSGWCCFVAEPGGFRFCVRWACAQGGLGYTFAGTLTNS